MRPLDREFENSVRSLLRGQVCIVGVGNRHRTDDGAGPRVIDRRGPRTRGVWLDAGVAPENFLEPIARTNPDTVLLVDAVAFGGSPGECRLIEASALDTIVVSTHTGSLGLLSDYLAARTGARIEVLAIQPERIDAGEGLSPPVNKAVHALAGLLSDLLSDDLGPEDTTERNPCTSSPSSEPCSNKWTR